MDALGFTWTRLDSLGLTWTHSDSLGFTWTHLDSLGFTWIHSDSLGFTRTHLDSLGLTRTHLDSLGFTWIHSDSLGFTWPHLDSLLDSLGLTWSHLVSLGLTRTHLDSLGLARIHLESSLQYKAVIRMGFNIVLRREASAISKKTCVQQQQSQHTAIHFRTSIKTHMYANKKHSQACTDTATQTKNMHTAATIRAHTVNNLGNSIKTLTYACNKPRAREKQRGAQLHKISPSVEEACLSRTHTASPRHARTNRNRNRFPGSRGTDKPV